MRRGDGLCLEDLNTGEVEVSQARLGPTWRLCLLEVMEEDGQKYLRETKVKKGLLMTDPGPGWGRSSTELGAELLPATGKPSDNNLSSVISVTATSGSGLS